MTIRSILGLSAVLFSGAAFAGDSKTTASTTIATGTEIVIPEDCTLDRTSDSEFALACFDAGNEGPSPLFIITCGDGTVVSYLGAGPGNGCDSAQAINECRHHRGCISVQ